MWYLVDAADTAKVIRHVRDDNAVSERHLHRAVRPSSLAALTHSAIEQAITTATTCTREVPVRGAAHTVLAIPIAGPDARPLAVQVWVGPSDAPREPAPEVDAFVWDGRQWTLMSTGVGGPVLPAGYPMLHGAWFLSRIIECEERDRLMTAALDPKPGTAWAGPMEVLTAAGTHTTKVYGFFRYHREESVRGLLLRIGSDREPGIVLPTYHNDAAAALLGGTTALIDIQRLQIVEWLTPPIADIAWRHHPASRDLDPADSDAFNLETTHLIHPDDTGIYLGALGDLAAGRVSRARGIVRLLTVTGGWQTVELYCIRLPHASPRFLTTLIRPISDGVPGILSDSD